MEKKSNRSAELGLETSRKEAGTANSIQGLIKPLVSQVY
jgi:hypothetical protein